MGGRWAAIAALCAAASAGACAQGPVHVEPFVVSRAVVHVQDRWLSLRVSQPTPAASARPLVVFITGDGGWRGKDLDAFTHLRAWGYPVAGVSAPDYLNHLAGDASMLPPQALADDIATIAGAAREALHLPADTRVLLFGVSRGADLAVVAAARRSLRGSVQGVLAVGLTKEEEYVHRPRGRRRAAAAASAASADDDPPLARPYVALRRVVAPVCVIQSTNDEYVRAADARVLFGPDSAVRRFQAVESRNHSFSDAREELYGAMKTSLAWVESHATPAEAQ